MTTTKIEQSGGKLSVTTPFHPDFARGAKRLGGRWDASQRAWSFDPRDEGRVRELCVKLFGTDGSPTEVLTIRARAEVCDSKETSYWLAGREVARVRGRDSGAFLGDGVVVLTGGFFSCGSVENPRIGRKDGTNFELRDVPRALAEKVHGEYHNVALLDAGGTVVKEATVEEPDASPVADLDLADAGDLLSHLHAADEAGIAPFEAEPATLPMAVNVEAIVRYLAATRPASAEYLLSYFAPEDREAVRPVVDRCLAERAS